MNIYLSSLYVRNLKKIKKKEPTLVPRIKKQITFFQANPNHPSLKLHKIQRGNSSMWSFWIIGDLRITFAYVEDGILFINIGNHSEVY